MSGPSIQQNPQDERRSELTHQEVLRRFHYDPESGALAYRVSSVGPIKAGAPVGRIKKHAHNGKSYRVCMIKRKRYKLHRVIWFYMTGEWPQGQIDHADGNGLNNSWNNLSVVTHADNVKNTRRRRDNKTGYAGIRLTESGKYQARIKSNRKETCLGTFADIQEAIAARKTAEKRFGFHPNHGTDRPL